MTTKDSCIVNFTLDERTATSVGTQEYESKGVASIIQSMLMFVVSVIACVQTKQTLQILKTKLATRQSNEKVIDPLHIMNTFCITMDNYFTLPRVIKQL